MQVIDGSLTLTAGGDDEGRAEEDLPAAVDGAELLIAFNPAYLLDGLGVVHSDSVRLAFTTPARPALMVPITADGAMAPTGHRQWPRRRARNGQFGLSLSGDAGPVAGLTTPFGGFAAFAGRRRPADHGRHWYDLQRTPAGFESSMGCRHGREDQCRSVSSGWGRWAATWPSGSAVTAIRWSASTATRTASAMSIRWRRWRPRCPRRGWSG